MRASDKLQLIIAAKQFLHRLGIKTMINVIGIEPELIETSSYSDLKSYLYEDSKDVFLVVAEDIFSDLKKTQYDEIKQICTDCKALFIFDSLPSGFQPQYYILNSDDQSDILNKFQDFFFKQNEPEDKLNADKAYLSERELDVLKAVALGYSNKEIANKLFISINTVITHRKNITEKLDVKSIAGLTVYAMINNLIKPEEVNS